MGGSPSSAGVSTGLLTDRYELTMVAAALADGTAERRCVFEVFARRLPEGRRYGVVAGTGRLVESIARFRFGDEELEPLRDVVDTGTLRSGEHTSELQSRRYLHSFPTRRSSDLPG